jgi:D-arabinitol dehydrogenase (NADP+)
MMRSVKIQEPFNVSVVDLPHPHLQPGEVLVRVMASGICGTDVHIYRGEYLGDYPVVPGHEFAGVVEAVGAGVTRFKPGDRVAVEPNIACNNCYNCLHNRQNFCLNWQAVGVSRPGGMSEFVLAPEAAVFPTGDLPFEAAAFVEPLSCVVHGIERAGIRLGDRVALLGAGPIGILLMQMARLQGAAHIACVERNRSRLELAQKMGVDAALESLDDLEPDGYDVVIDATGAVPVMARTLEFARYGGAVLLFGVPPTGKMVEWEAFTIFRKGLTILSSFTSLRNSYQAVALLQSGQIDVSQLISHRLPLDDFRAAVEMIDRSAEGVRKVMILPNG